MSNWYSDTSSDDVHVSDGLIATNIMGRFVVCNAAVAYRPAMVKKLLRAKAAPPVKEAASAQELLDWLNAD